LHAPLYNRGFVETVFYDGKPPKILPVSTIAWATFGMNSAGRHQMLMHRQSLGMLSQAYDQHFRNAAFILRHENR
jgi:hypothetical protein